MKPLLFVLKTSEFETVSPKGFSEKFPLYKQEFLREGYLNQKKAEVFLRQEVLKSSLPAKFVSDKQFLKEKCANYDIIITLGGDGAFLTAAQHCKNSFILGINSHPHRNPKKGSIGALTGITVQQIPYALQKIKANQYHFESWPRLCVAVNGKKLNGLAVNEIFFGPVEQDKICDFRLTVGRKWDIFPSSGLLVCTPRGSTAWHQNAGGKPFSHPAIGFLVREPNLRRCPRFTKGVIPLSQKLIIEAGGENTFLSFDSRVENRYYLTNKTQKIVIEMAREDLRVIKIE